MCGEVGAERDPCAACEDSLASLRVPRACPRCAVPLPGFPRFDPETALPSGGPPVSSGSSSRPCPACIARPPAFDFVVAPWRFGSPLSSLIHRMKYRRDLAAAAALGRLLAHALDARTATRAAPDAVIGMPMSTPRLVRRGFNHAEELAATVRRELGWLLPRGIRLKRTHSPPQAQARTVAERFENVAETFRVVRFPCHARRVAVVDDVMTTGATASALAACLRNHGVQHVEIWCCARTPPN